MIQKQEIIDLVDQFLLASESESYLIDVTVSRDNQIVITSSKSVRQVSQPHSAHFANMPSSKAKQWR